MQIAYFCKESYLVPTEILSQAISAKMCLLPVLRYDIDVIAEDVGVGVPAKIANLALV
jgi:hypothetical protein